MMIRSNLPGIIGFFQLTFFTLLSPISACADLLLGPVEYVATDSVVIKVPGYSVPSFTYWDGDPLKDLLSGEGGTTALPGKVRVYLNVGTKAAPRFSSFSYAQSGGVDLVIPGGG